MVETVQGREVTVTFDGSLCIHSRHCVLSHPEVFVPNIKGDWIFPDAAPAETVLHIGFSCPSGAIRVTRNDGTATSDIAPRVNTLRLRENGPLALEAPITLNGAALPNARATLCRCGASQNKPWCDSSHLKIGFQATGEPPAMPSEPRADRGGVVDLQPAKDGPLRLVGNIEVISGTGRTLNRATKLFLCRCGQSNNKPYCDGSHKAAGFTAD
jgi:CDGSH-type Zn-finger protein/uncharacterized Fe-S cluster protein YjdI